MKTFFSLFLWLCATMAMAGNRIYSERFKSLTSTVNGDWMNRPVMVLGSMDRLHIDFDELSHNFHRLTYHLDHCEADWTVSEQIFESDWLEGFNDNQIEDYDNSVNTTVLYTHYHLCIPNDKCRLKLGGNYRLTVIDEDEDNEKVLEVEFFVLNPLMDIGLKATTNTDIDHNDSHQQIDMTLNFNGLRVDRIDEQLRTVVMQNWREDNARHDVTPNFINDRALTWTHNRQLIFDAGNVYHKFEVLDVSHATMGLDRIVWDGEYYQAYPFTATVRKNYLTDQSAMGAFCIRNSDYRETDTTCDYVWMNYTLQAPYQGDIYLDAQWTNDANRESYRLAYDESQQLYFTAIMQKQGYYSYQFVRRDGSVPPSEGSFFQTENNYQALVYYKGTGERTWQLVGYRAIALR